MGLHIKARTIENIPSQVPTWEGGKEYLNLEEYETIYAYGDGSGDKQMLSLAHKSIKY